MLRLTLAITLATLAFGAPASAQQPSTVAPPGNSGVDEYLETVPGAAGSRAPDDQNRIRRPAALSAKQTRALAALGRDGKAAASTIGETAPTPTRAVEAPAAGSKAESGASAAASRELADDRSHKARSVLSSVADTMTGGGDGGAGMGALLPAVLLVTLAAGVVVRVRRGTR